MSCYFHSQFMLKKYYFCKKSVHSFLGLSKSMDSPLPPPPPPISKCGLGLISNETPRVFNPNVIESSSLALLNSKPMTPTSPPSPPPSLSKKKGHGGIGFVDDMGGGVDGLMSCTESLGFESCDERRVDDDDDDDRKTNDYQHMEFCEEERDRWRRKRNEEKRSERNNKKFPPPLSSLNQNGQPCFYLKPERKNGRLELTEVKIQRNEILRAVRENGHLRLHLISNDVCSKINEEQENEETKQEEQELHNLEEEEEDNKVEELWKYRVNGEGSRRCHELVMSHLNHDYHHHHINENHSYHGYHHHHHHINDHHSLHVWRQPCVTTR